MISVLELAIDFSPRTMALWGWKRKEFSSPTWSPCKPHVPRFRFPLERSQFHRPPRLEGKGKKEKKERGAECISMGMAMIETR